MSVKERISEGWKNYLAFMLTLSAIPFLVASYTVVSICKYYWLKILSSRYVHLDFIRRDTIRTLVDTHRNQGVFNFLLCVEGHAKPAELKQKLLENVLDRRDATGYPIYPRMCSALVSRWGSYAWDNHPPFKIENHFFIATGLYRGRAIGDNNIQSYVSEIVSKYFPVEQPPWQFIVIPSPTTDKHYILVRIHHLLLTCERPISIGDMLLIDRRDNLETVIEMDTPDSHLDQLEYKLSAIPELYEKLGETCSNIWNELIAEYDPLESTRAFKTSPGIFHCVGLAVIVLVSTFKDMRKSFPTDIVMTIRLFFSALRQECHRRDFTFGKIFMSPFVTIHPRKLPTKLAKWTIKLLKISFLWPMIISDEIAAIKQLLKTGSSDYSQTLAWKWGGLVDLALRASRELWKLVGHIYVTPRRIYEDVLATNKESTHALQQVPLGGRKVCAWSRPILRSSVKKICNTINVSPNDLYLYATTEAVAKYLEQNNHKTPLHIPIIVNANDTHFILSQSEEYRYKEMKNGFICTTLPLRSKPTLIRKTLANYAGRQKLVTMVNPVEVSHALPSPCARIVLNLLSRKFSLMYEHTRHDYSGTTTILGQKVLYFVYWKPPQANATMSLTVVEYEDTVRLGVMCDARLAPGQTIPAQHWPEVIESLTADRSSRRTVSENRPQKSGPSNTQKRRLSIHTEAKNQNDNELAMKKPIGSLSKHRADSLEKSKRASTKFEA